MKPLTTPLSEETTNIIHALSIPPCRNIIVHLVGAGTRGMHVKELEGITKIPQAVVSQNLIKMRKLGIVANDKKKHPWRLSSLKTKLLVMYLHEFDTSASGIEPIAFVPR